MTHIPTASEYTQQCSFSACSRHSPLTIVHTQHNSSRLAFRPHTHTHFQHKHTHAIDTHKHTQTDTKHTQHTHTQTGNTAHCHASAGDSRCDLTSPVGSRALEPPSRSACSTKLLLAAYWYCRALTLSSAMSQGRKKSHGPHRGPLNQTCNRLLNQA